MRRAASLSTVALLTTAASFAFVSLLASSAFAITQPDGTVIPTRMGCSGNKPTGLNATFACACTAAGVCNIGASCPGGSTSCDPGTNGTCESTIWHQVNDDSCIPSLHSGLDVQAEAATTPETFKPTCALTFTILTRGTSQFQNTFGWYNVTGSKPDPSDLHPMFACGDTAGKSVVLDLSSEPAYKGGEIGFFMLTPEGHPNTKMCAGGDCCPTLARLAGGVGYAFYSQRAFNPDNAGASSYIHLLTYNSHLSKSKFYFAWEDLFSGGDNNFTDLVASVDGVQCGGGGQTCDTTQKGICALGITQCAGGTVSCTPINKATVEACNGLDDDCNGKVDDGAKCATAGEQCVNGKCVPPCGSGEFKCDPGKACDANSGLCVDPTCVNKTCPTDQVCRNGACVTPCDGVVCPYGTRCVGDACVNLCAGVTCKTGEVCREGICFGGCASCSGISCGGGLKCDGKTSDCVDPSCSTSCAAGTHCKAGSCVSDCDGAKCPDGSSCTAGACYPNGVVPDGGVEFPDAGGNPDGSTGGDGGGGGAIGEQPAASACSCDVPGGREAGAAWAIVGLGLAAALVRARRRSR
jgi:hypothetical protein